MQITTRLLSSIQRLISGDPSRFLALRLSHVSGSMTWEIADGVLTTVVGEAFAALSVDLSGYTIGGLVAFLQAQHGYVVPFGDVSDLSQLSALALMDGAGDIEKSNGDHLWGYTSALWAFFEAVGAEVKRARDALSQMLLQLCTRTASDEWLDELGSYYGVPRLNGEVDASYGPRIIAEVLRPRGNNFAIAQAIADYTGQQVSVVDVDEHNADGGVYEPSATVFDGTWNFDGSKVFASASSPTLTFDGTWDFDGSKTFNGVNTSLPGGSGYGHPRYGLFDVQYGFDVIGSAADLTSFAATVRSIVDRLRDAGTHLRSLTLTDAAVVDVVSPASDSPTLDLTMQCPGLADTVAAASDDLASVVGMGMGDVVGRYFDGQFAFDGSVHFSGGVSAGDLLVLRVTSGAGIAEEAL